MTDTLTPERLAELEITPEARDRFIALISVQPYGSVSKMSLEAGIPGTRGQRKRLVAADAEIQSALQDARGEFLAKHKMSIDDLLSKLSFVVHDDGNSSQLRAIQTGLHMHGVSTIETARVEHVGEIGVAGEVTVTHDYDELLDRLARIGVVRARAAGDADAAAVVDAGRPALLPARPD